METFISKAKEKRVKGHYRNHKIMTMMVGFRKFLQGFKVKICGHYFTLKIYTFSF